MRPRLHAHCLVGVCTPRPRHRRQHRQVAVIAVAARHRAANSMNSPDHQCHGALRHRPDRLPEIEVAAAGSVRAGEANALHSEKRGTTPAGPDSKKGVLASDCCTGYERTNKILLACCCIWAPSLGTSHTLTSILLLDSSPDTKEGGSLPDNGDLIGPPTLLPPHLPYFFHHRVALGEQAHLRLVQLAACPPQEALHGRVPLPPIFPCQKTSRQLT